MPYSLWFSHGTVVLGVGLPSKSSQASRGRCCQQPGAYPRWDLSRRGGNVFRVALSNSIVDKLSWLGIVLIKKPNVVSSRKQQSEQVATARVKASCVSSPRVESWSPRGVQTPKSRPVAST